MAGASLTTPSTGPSMVAGVPKPGAAKAKSASKPIQVKAHTRAAPSSKPNRPAAPASPLLDPNQTLSGQNLLNAARQLAATQTQGPLTELQKQIAANNAQTNGTVNLVGGYYNQLEPFVQQGVTNSGNIASGLNSTLANIGSGTQSQLQGIGQSALANIAKYAPPGDGSTSNAATADLAAQIARQQGLAAQQAGTYRDFGAAQGANYQGLANSNLGTYGLQGQEALKGIAQSGTVKNEPLVSKIAALREQQGALTATDLGKLRQQEVGNQIARAGLGLKQQGLNVTAANDQARVAATLRGQNITAANDAANQRLKLLGIRTTAQNDAANQALKAQGLGVQRQNDLAGQTLKQEALNIKAAKSGGGVKPLTTAQNNLKNQQLGKIISAIQTWQQQGIKNSKGVVIEPHPTNAQMRQVLSGAYEGPLVEAAFELLGYGSIDRSTAQALHNMGVHGTTFRNAPVKVTPNYRPPGPSSGPNASNPGTQR